jgi:hypothetical protein
VPASGKCGADEEKTGGGGAGSVGARPPARPDPLAAPARTRSTDAVEVVELIQLAELLPRARAGILERRQPEP